MSAPPKKPSRLQCGDRTRRAWVVTWLALALAIPLIGVFGNPLLGGLRGVLGNTGVVVLLALALSAGGAWTTYRTQRIAEPAAWTWLAAGATGAVLTLYFVPMGPRWMHVVLFVPLGLSSQRTFGVGWGIAIALAIGGGDEALQYGLADRTGSLLDVLANAASAAAGTALGIATEPSSVSHGPVHGHPVANPVSAHDDDEGTTGGGAAMAEYTLYGFNASTYVRTIRMLLHEKGIAYEQVPVDILKGEGQSAEHRKRHPFGKVPTLEASGVNLFESQAIAELIEDQHPMPPLIPADTVERAKMRQWISVIEHYTYPQVAGTLVWQRVVNPALGEATDEQAVRAAMPDVDFHFALLDEALGASKYLAGPHMSLADLYLAPIVAYVSMTPESERLFAHHLYVGEWFQTIQQRESFRATPPM